MRSLLSAAMLVALLSCSVAAAVITVPTDYSRISAAVSMAEPNDTVRILPGKYMGRVGTVSKNLTIQSLFATSGDTAYIGSTVIDGSGWGGEIIRCAGASSKVLVEGLTLLKGDGDFSNSNIGGGIYVDSSSVTIRHCKIDSCWAFRGAGVVVQNGTISIDSCSIEHGVVEICTGGYCGLSYGAGIYAVNSHVDVRGTAIRENDAQDGSAMYISGSTLIMEGCDISSNLAYGGGAGLAAINSNVSITRCAFYNNTSRGDGFSLKGILTVQNGSCNITASTFAANQTFVGSYLSFSGGNVQLARSIVWESVSSGLNPIARSGPGLTFSAEFCDVSGDDSLGVTCFSSNPIFCDSANSDYYLDSQSPCAPANNGSGQLIGAFPVACSITDVNDQAGLIPYSYSLSQNYPNPFNPTTRIDFALSRVSKVQIDVFNALGQKVRSLLDQQLPAGNHTATWDSRSDDGRSVSSGVYLYRIHAEDFVETKKMVLLK